MDVASLSDGALSVVQWQLAFLGPVGTGCVALADLGASACACLVVQEWRRTR